MDLNEDGAPKEKGDAVNLEDNALIVDISDAMSEREKVLFTVHTKVRSFLRLRRRRMTMNASNLKIKHEKAKIGK